MNEIVTPAFVFDYDALSARAKFLRRALHPRNVKLCYAVKANPFLIPALVAHVDCFEVCSPGEYRLCRLYGVPPEKLVLSGVYKAAADIDDAVTDCGERAVYTVESPAQFDLLESAATSHGLVLPVLLRLSSGNQFGMDYAAVRALVRRNSPHLRISGLQYYGGTQKKTAHILAETEKVRAAVRALRNDAGFVCKRVEYGAGLRVRYFVAESPVDEEGDLSAALTAFEGVDEAVMEVGRFLAASCGEYHTTAVDVKRTEDADYCIVDGGIHHLNYYGQTMAMKAPFITHTRDGKPLLGEGETREYTLCGSLCTVADVLLRRCPLADLRTGDVLVFHNTGAYTVTEGIYLFLSRDMPRIYGRRDGKLALLRDGLPTDKLNAISIKGE